MKIWLGLAVILSLTGCYTQLYTGGYAERTVYPYPYDRPASPRDSAVADSVDSVAAADTLKHEKTVIVNNYYDNSPSYRGYSLEAWDYPFVSLGFYSGRYRDYYGPYWWHDGYSHRGHYRRNYDPYPRGGASSGSGSSGPYQSDHRIFPPASSQPPLHKGRRSEPPAQAAPAAKPATPAPSTAPAESSRSGDGNASSGSSNSSSGSSGSSSGSGNDHPDLHKGRR